jgi:predicted AAA+ superfamily ATPase
MRELIRQKIIDSLAAPVPLLTRRDIRLPSIHGKALAVVGMRRTGKSTFLWQTLGDHLQRGVDRYSLLFFSFEDERLGGMRRDDLQILVEEYYALHPKRRDKDETVFFLDEIQVVSGWELFARRLLETENVKLFLSGSSARLLSREVATSMRGRAMEVLVHPFSFREYLRHLQHEPDTEGDRLTKSQRSMIEKDLRDYLSLGGFPEAVGASSRDRSELLRGYVDAVLLRDVIERFEVTHPLVLRWMVRQLLANAAGSFSINKFYADLRSQGIPIAKDTLHDYLGYLEDAFLIRTVSVSSSSERRRMVNPRKSYPVDPGFIPLFDVSGKTNMGHALETCVLIELERRGAVISYVRAKTGAEVDFCARFPDGRQELIQVCSDIESPGVLERELKGLEEARGEHRTASHHLVVLSGSKPSGCPASVRWHSASEWLLSEVTV